MIASAWNLHQSIARDPLNDSSFEGATIGRSVGPQSHVDSRPLPAPFTWQRRRSLPFPGQRSLASSRYQKMFATTVKGLSTGANPIDFFLNLNSTNLFEFQRNALGAISFFSWNENWQKWPDFHQINS